jgi:nucleoid-associated protein YejK
MKKNGTEKAVEKKEGPKAAPKSNGGVSLLKGKSGKTRSTWFREVLLANKKEKKSDSKILKEAVAEFGEKNVGEGTRYTVKHQRTCAIYDAAHKKNGLKPSDAPFVKYAE